MLTITYLQEALDILVLLLNRLLIIDGQPQIALMTLKATDKLSEIDSARKLTIVRNYLEKRLLSIPLIAVTVGYSSSEVKDLIKETATVLSFNEKLFVNQLRTKITELLAQVSRERSGDLTTNTNVLELLENLNNRLENLGVKRTEEINQIAESLNERVRLIAEPIKKEREIRTRWELLDEIYKLNELCSQNPSDSKLDREQAIMKSILVANESYLKIKEFDFLGGLYMDTLAEAKNILMSSPQEDKKKYYYLNQLQKGRIDILRELNRILRGDKNLVDYLTQKPVQYVLSISSLLLVTIGYLYINSYRLFDDNNVFLPNLFKVLIESTFIWLVFVFSFMVGLIYLLISLRQDKLKRILKRVRDKWKQY